jgi:hypothetical protein
MIGSEACAVVIAVASIGVLAGAGREAWPQDAGSPGAAPVQPSPAAAPVQPSPAAAPPVLRWVEASLGL